MDLKITTIFSLWFVCCTVALRSEHGTYETISKLEFFIDKTEMLQMLFNSSSSLSENPYYFITCPYTFGKMTNFLMIKKFAEIEPDTNNKPKFWMHTSALDIFKNLKISEYPDIIMNHMSKYPVLFLDLWISPDLRIHDTSLMLMDALRSTIVENYEWLGTFLEENIDKVESDFHLDRKDVEFFLNLFNEDISEDDLDSGLLNVCRLLYNYFKTPVVLLIGEYEKVALRAFATSNEEGLKYYKKLNKMLTRVLTEGRQYIKFALIAGTGSLGFSLDTRKYNLLGFSFGPKSSKKNNLFTHYPFLDEHPFTPYYGFIESEVIKICKLNKDCEFFENTLLSEGYSTTLGRKIYNAASVTNVYIKTACNWIRPIPFSWIEREFKELLVPFVRSKVFREKMEDATKYGYFQYPIKKTFPSDGLEKLINLASRGFDNIYQEHVDMFFTICFEQGYFTHVNGKNNFTFPNFSLKTQLRRQLAGLTLVDNKIEIPDAILV